MKKGKKKKNNLNDSRFFIKIIEVRIIKVIACFKYWIIKVIKLEFYI